MGCPQVTGNNAKNDSFILVLVILTFTDYIVFYTWKQHFNTFLQSIQQ